MSLDIDGPVYRRLKQMEKGQLNDTTQNIHFLVWFLQFGLQALDDSSDPRQEAAKESEKEVSPQLVIQLYWISTD